MARVWKFGSDVDTDQIVPGRYAPYMRPDAELGDAAFIEARPEFARSAKPGDLVVALHNFGCGSSREYAPEALLRRRIGAIIAASFARIFYRNALNLGIPLIESEEIASALEDGQEATLDLPARVLLSEGRTFTLPPMPAFAFEILQAGGIIPYVKKHGCFPGEA